MHYILQKRRTPALVETTFLESDEMKCFHKARIRFIQYNNRLRYSNCLKIWIYIHIRRAQRKLWRSGCKPTCARGPKNNIRCGWRFFGTTSLYQKVFTFATFRQYFKSSMYSDNYKRLCTDAYIHIELFNLGNGSAYLS